MYKTMTDLWDYLQNVKQLPTSYISGKFGQKINGKYAYDCVCLIKSFPWCSGNAGAEPKYKANGIPDEWIGAYYNKASKKGDISTLPDAGIYLVYLNNSHIGVYNASTGTVIECCAGNTMQVVERSLHYYDNTTFKWNKWSNLYWCSEDIPYDYVGYVDAASSTSISGWAYNGINDESVKVTIKVYFKKCLRGTYTVVANKYREDLAKLKVYGNGYHGFTLNLDTTDYDKGEYTIVAYVCNDKLPFSNNKAKSFTVVKKTPFVAGAKYKLKNTPVYSSEHGKSIGNRTGTYYVWSTAINNNRVKMTNSSKRVGVPGQVSFFVNKNSLV